MSLLNEYMKKEQLMKQLRDELQQLEQDQRLQSELEFKSKLEQLMQSHDKTASDVIFMLDPGSEQEGKRSGAATSAQGGSRRKRKLKIYRNPHTGEVVKTRGGNQKTLKAWKEEYGRETVEQWLERTE